MGFRSRKDVDNVNETGEIRPFHAVSTHPTRRDYFKTWLLDSILMIDFLQHVGSPIRRSRCGQQLQHVSDAKSFAAAKVLMRSHSVPPSDEESAVIFVEF